MVSLALTASFLALLAFYGDGLLADVGRMGHKVNYSIAILNLIPLRFFAWDGGKVFAWSKAVWSLLAVGAVLLRLAVALV